MTPQSEKAATPPEVADESEPIPTENELEPTAGGELAPDLLDSMITVAGKIDRYDKAMTTILNAVMKRTYAGDWVSHDRSDVPVKLRTASPSGPGCERIAAFLGISERNWHGGEKFWIEDGKHYGFRFEADFTLGGRSVRGVGEVTTKNKFFSYTNANGWKELTDIREDHVRKSAMRECSKDGVRRLLGLRKVPILKLAELGFDLNHVHFVNFKTVGEAMREPGTPPPQAQRASNPPPPQTAATKGDEPPKPERTFRINSHEAKQGAGPQGKVFYVFKATDVKDVKFEFTVFGDHTSERIKSLVAAQNSEQIITASFKFNGNHTNLEEIKEVTPT